MDVLLIGGTRFLGPLLVFRLLAGGHRVTILNRGTRPDPFGAFLPRVEGITADRRTDAFNRAMHGRRFDVVVDFAAYEREDAEGAVRALLGRAGHYVFISTGQVYLVREDCPRPATEHDYLGPIVPRPHDPYHLDSWLYGVGKRACEDALVTAWEEHRFPATRLRIPMVNGERDYHGRIESYLFRMLDGGPILVPDGGHAPTRHVYGADVVRAITSMMGRRHTFGEAYNLCQDETPTLRELLAILAELLGASPRYVDVSSADLEAAGLSARQISPFSSKWMSFLDPAKAKRDLDFKHTPVREYLASIVASFLAHPPAEPPEGYALREKELSLVK
jgi:nucleoside-diphosphate-sugar epimerase